MPPSLLVGTWRLVSFEAQDEDGNVDYPFGADAVGFITYTADGFMSVQFGRADRPHLAAADWGVAADVEVAASARDSFSYCGTYEVRDDAVVHRIDLSLMPDLIGTEQTRSVEHDGDTVTLTTTPTRFGGRQRVGRLVWRRA